MSTLRKLEYIVMAIVWVAVSILTYGGLVPPPR